jgi:hypothetical protein
VETLLHDDRAKVLSLAYALETHKTLSGDDIVAVMEHTQGPLVDGRPYADQEFLDLLEEYHQAAAMAHRTHGRVPLAMPVPSLFPVIQGAAARFDGGPALDGGPQHQGGPAAQDGGAAPGGDWAPGSGPAAGS